MTVAPSPVTLRWYQEKGLNDIRAALGKGSRSVLFALPTGGGKTVTYSAMAAGAAKKGNNVLILEHRKELIRQASLALGRLGVRHRVIAPPDKIAAIRRAHVKEFGWPMIDQSACVAVASVQTLGRRMDWLKLFNPLVVIIDEAHHSVAGTWRRIIEALPNAVFVGVTATPCRADGQPLGEIFKSLVLGPSYQDMIDDGYLVPFRLIVPPRKANLKNVKRRGGDLDPDAQAAELDKPHITGDAVKHYSEIAPGKRAIVFCANIKHAEHVADAFKAAGWRFEVVTGEMDDDLRDERIYGLADGRLHGIVTVDICGEGTDIPAAEVGIMLRYTESYALFKQQAGRFSRPVYAPGFDLSTREGRVASIAASDKPYAILIDHVGNIGSLTDEGFKPNHGLPQHEPEWSLSGKLKRISDTEAGSSMRNVQCPICFGVAGPRVICDLPWHGPSSKDGKCTHEFKAERMPEQRAGQLVELTEEATAAIAARAAQGAARSIQQLKAIGMSDARAAHVMAARKEKEALQKQLRELMAEYTKRRLPHGVAGVYELKPKALRSEIERLRNELGHIEFMSAKTQEKTASA